MPENDNFKSKDFTSQRRMNTEVVELIIKENDGVIFRKICSLIQYKTGLTEVKVKGILAVLFDIDKIRIDKEENTVHWIGE